jgi:hypothetical protein
MDKFDHWISFNHLNKFVISLSAVIEASCSPLGPHLESDLGTDLYSDNPPIANMDKFDRQISFNRLNKSAISLSTAIGASGSPLGPRLERDLTIDLYSASTLITIKDESNHRISFRRFQKSTTSLQEVIKV